MARRSVSSVEARDKIRFARFTRTVIKWVAGGLGAFFTYLQVKDIRADAILTPIFSDVLWRVTLIFYYWSWIFGTNRDTNIQELAYTAFPGRGKWPAKAFGALFLFVVVAAVLLSAQGSIIYFSLALTAFLIVDHALWFYLKKFLKPSIDKSRAEYNFAKKYYDLARLDVVERQLMGDWRYKRLTFGAVTVILIDLFAFSGSFRGVVAQSFGDAAHWLSAQEVTNVIYTALVFVFVGVMELWHWIMRIATATRINSLDDLEKKYKLIPYGS